MQQSIFIPYRFPGLNDYINAERKHRMMAAKMKKEYTDLATLFLSRLSPYTKPISLRFVWHEKNKKRDPDNIVFAKKFLLDGMVNSNVIPNDNQRWIKGFVEFWEVSEKEGVRIDIWTE